LHSFRHLDGREGQGVLYKPDDFDSTKKYPVLIVFYGAFSNNLNQFHVPSYIDQAMEPGKSPAWFVNNGYLVFTPDIYTTTLKYGPSAFNVIEGAATYLKRFPYVDSSKLGCASHSWSAKLGAYLFTHSQSFNATAISEGFIYANVINMALSARNGVSQLEGVETGQEYGNLYENKEAWLEQTTVLQADKAKSPLLLFCNKESSPDYQDQTLQLFTALRRLDKAVWWLKYDNGEHTLRDLKELKDYTIRYTQFFDHYLKEAPAPLWMTQGLPFTVKGIESRYELDPTGSCGKECTICKKWNTQYKKHLEMFNQPIQEWHLE
jgi:dipeptidyl aminopeptidase/acylaminoacyl peptidase